MSDEKAQRDDPRRPVLPPGCEWADDGKAFAVALAEMERCAETLARLAAIDRGDLVEGDPVP